MMENIDDAKKCLYVLGEAWRADWSDFDGRTLRDQLSEIKRVLDGEMTVHEFMQANEIIEDPKYTGVFRWK